MTSLNPSPSSGTHTAGGPSKRLRSRSFRGRSGLSLIIVQLDRIKVEITEKIAKKDITDIDSHILRHLLPQEKGENTKSIQREVEAGHMINIAAVKDTIMIMTDTITKGGDD